MAERNPGQQGGDVSGGDDLQERVGGIVLQAAHLACGVVERQALAGAERSNRSLIKPLLAREAEMVLVAEMDEPHNPPEIVDPVGVVERHAPAVLLRRETAQKQDAGVLRQERREWMLFGGHIIQR